MMMMRARWAPGCNDMPMIVPPSPRNVNHLGSATRQQLDPLLGRRPRTVDEDVDERWTNEKLLGTTP